VIVVGLRFSGVDEGPGAGLCNIQVHAHHAVQVSCCEDSQCKMCCLLAEYRAGTNRRPCGLIRADSGKGACRASWMQLAVESLGSR
jgi:hypothetical protein